MCGLCGVVELDRPAARLEVESMLDDLRHRGPDGRGVFEDDGVSLGHLRLAIIDLTDAGLQPMEDRALRLLHNGEIYNYLELRDELRAKGHAFRSETDTEVILAAYREWGERCVERFNGMWAFAIWDADRRTLFASRDRFGVKPFYYRVDGPRFAFASEPWPLRQDGANLGAVRDYVEQGFLDQGDETFFAGVVRLPPAHSLSFGPAGLRLSRYWSLEPGDPPADPVESIRETFLDAVRLQLRSDVPVGTCLSGGIDSSSIAVAVRHHGHEHQKTVTAYFGDPGFDERPFARAVVESTGAEAHWISFTAVDLVENLGAIVQAQGEPFGSTSICAGWYVMREAARAGLKVMLDGQGGDEILAGYRAFFGYRLSDLLRAGRLGEATAELRAFAGVNGPRWAAVALVSPHVPERVRLGARSRLRGAAPLSGPALVGLEHPAGTNGVGFTDRLRRQLHLVLTRRGLPELLRYEDRNSMAHSLEARVPFLDHRLVELAFSLDGSELIRRGETKSVLRRALADLLPPAVSARRDKLGFVTPEARFLRGRLGENFAADVFASRAFAERGFADARAARERLERHRRGELEAGMELWRALNLELLGAPLPRSVKVLVLTTSYPTPAEPLPGIFVREHALAASTGSDVAVLHLERGGRRGVTTTLDHGLRVYRSGYPERPLALSVPSHFAAAAAGFRRLRHDGFVPDLVHAHFFLAALPAVLLSRRPVVTSEHWSVFLPEDPAHLPGAFLWAARFAYRRSCAVLPVSEALREGLVAHGVRARFVVVPNAVDTDLFRPGHAHAGSPPRLLTVSALNRGKGVEELLRAFDRIRARIPGARLDVVGEGPERASLTLLATELGLDGDIAFHGLLPKSDVAALMRDADLYVLASRFETNGVTVLEALASGLPVVGYALPALRELVDETNGRLVPPGDVGALADAVVAAVAAADAYDARAIAAAARDRYGREAVAARLGAVFEQCLTS